jgi:hypothetical protein
MITNSIMTFIIMTLSKTALSLITISITTQCKMTFSIMKIGKVTLSIMTLSITTLSITLGIT